MEDLLMITTPIRFYPIVIYLAYIYINVCKYVNLNTGYDYIYKYIKHLPLAYSSFGIAYFVMSG